MMAALAAAPLGCAAARPTAAARRGRQDRRRWSPIFPVWKHRVVAGLIHRALGTDLFEIRPATPYPEDYLATVEQARQERDSGYEPALAGKVADMAGYDTVFLGFPIWGETAPPVIRAFLSAHDLAGKVLIPFVTHGGYGLGSSQSVLARHAPKARLRQGFVMEADQERRTMNQVNDWLNGIRTGK